MISLEQLKQLVAISNCGTVSKAAESLFLSQPALSRSMQRMETEMGVILFERFKNRIEFNENGKLAVDFAKKLLSDYHFYMESIKSFDKSHKTISVGVCAPAPLWEFVPQLSSLFPEKMINSEIKENALLKKGLMEKTYHIIITSEKIEMDGCISQEFCRENLYLCVPVGHKLEKKEVVSYADFEGLSMLLYQDIGSWNKMREHLVKTRFIVQNDRTAFNDLIAESLLPVFASNITIKRFGAPANRIAIPISEKDATEIFYLSVLKSNRELISHL